MKNRITSALASALLTIAFTSASEKSSMDITYHPESFGSLDTDSDAETPLHPKVPFKFVGVHIATPERIEVVGQPVDGQTLKVPLCGTVSIDPSNHEDSETLIVVIREDDGRRWSAPLAEPVTEDEPLAPQPSVPDDGFESPGESRVVSTITRDIGKRLALPVAEGTYVIFLANGDQESNRCSVIVEVGNP